MFPTVHGPRLERGGGAGGDRAEPPVSHPLCIQAVPALAQSLKGGLLQGGRERREGHLSPLS